MRRLSEGGTLFKFLIPTLGRPDKIKEIIHEIDKFTFDIKIFLLIIMDKKLGFIMFVLLMIIIKRWNC